MKLQYLGHACFLVEGCLVIDPYKDGSVPGLKPLRVKAAKVICTHGHADHSGVECVELDGGECELEIREVASFSQYDTVFLGYPIWWGDLPMVVYSFCRKA